MQLFCPGIIDMLEIIEIFIYTILLLVFVWINWGDKVDESEKLDSI